MTGLLWNIDSRGDTVKIYSPSPAMVLHISEKFPNGMKNPKQANKYRKSQHYASLCVCLGPYSNPRDLSNVSNYTPKS